MSADVECKNTHMFETIFRGRTQSEADLVISLLRGSGFHPPDLEMSPHISVAGAEISYRADVPAAELQAARTVLQQAGYGC